MCARIPQCCKLQYINVMAGFNVLIRILAVRFFCEKEQNISRCLTRFHAISTSRESLLFIG